MNLQHMQCFSKNYWFCLLILYFILDYFVCVCVAHLKAEFSGSFQFGDVNMLADVILFLPKTYCPLTFHIEKEA